MEKMGQVAKRAGVKRVGVIGYPIAHSLSPVFQQAAFDFHSIPATYEAWATRPEELTELVTRLRQPEYFGANVTVPHKVAVMALLDEVVPLAKRIGAVNTIVNRAGRLIGHNTDVAGFLEALERDAAYTVAGKRAVLLGAGGAARAVGFALSDAGVAEIIIANRAVERAERLAKDLAATSGVRGNWSVVRAIGMETDPLRDVLQEADLLVNATSVGMRHTSTEQSLPLPESLLHPGLLVYDLVYNPAQTPLLRAGAARGAACLNGLAMLVYQGAASFALWTGRHAPVGLMMERAREALAVL